MNKVMQLKVENSGAYCTGGGIHYSILCASKQRSMISIKETRSDLSCPILSPYIEQILSGKFGVRKVE